MKKVLHVSFVCIFVLLSGAYVFSISTVTKEAEVVGDEVSLSTIDLSSITSNIEDYQVPIVVIDTLGQEISYSKKGVVGTEQFKAQMQIFYPDDLKNNKLEPRHFSDIYISVRGNTTRLLPKKQYSLNLVDALEQEKKLKLLDMPKSSKWILNASFEDKSLMRNKLAYETASEIMDYAPRCEYVEVYLINDRGSVLTQEHYQGVYLLTESIDRDESRINIEPTIKGIADTSFIVARNRAKSDDILLNNYGYETYLYDYNVVIEYPKTNLTEEKYQFINQTMSIFERMLYSDRFNDPLVGYEQFIDVDSFVDYLVINEFFRNTDAGYFSTYLHKNYDEKIKAGPVWDFDTSMGNSNAISHYHDETGFYMPQTAWFGRLMEDINFAKTVVERYRYLRKTSLSDEQLLLKISDYEQALKLAAKRNFERWPIALINQSEMIKTNYDLLVPYEKNVNEMLDFFEENPQLKMDTSNRAQNFDREIQLLKQFVVKRGAWLDDNIDSFLKWAE